MGNKHSHHHHHHYHHQEGLKHSKVPTASDYILSPSNKSHAGKPNPPSQVQAHDVTHCSATLSWQPPRHAAGSPVFAFTIEVSCPKDPKTWTIVTNSCQGNSYQVKHLTPSTQYLFRVRAENIYGLSKASSPTEVVETKMFGVDQQLYSGPVQDKPRNTPQRRHSINLHLEGAVTSILNHTDIEVKASTLSREDGRGGGGGAGSREEGGFERDRSSSLQREAALRSSLQTSRKRSVPILLPGTRSNSLHKLRDSHTFPITFKARSGESSDGAKRREQRWRDRLSSESSGSTEDAMDNVSKQECSSQDGLKSASTPSPLPEDTELSDNPWERNGSVPQVGNSIMAAQLSDDIKMALYSRSVPETFTTWSEGQGHSIGSEVREAGQADFRTLRSLLTSDDIIMKSSRSLPDVAQTSVKRSANNNTLSIIMDQEEEEEVRITTL